MRAARDTRTPALPTPARAQGRGDAPSSPPVLARTLIRLRRIGPIVADVIGTLALFAMLYAGLLIGWALGW